MVLQGRRPSQSDFPHFARDSAAQGARRRATTTRALPQVVRRARTSRFLSRLQRGSGKVGRGRERSQDGTDQQQAARPRRLCPLAERRGQHGDLAQGPCLWGPAHASACVRRACPCAALQRPMLAAEHRILCGLATSAQDVGQGGPGADGRRSCGRRRSGQPSSTV